METKRLYICPLIEVCPFHSKEGVMLQASLHDDEAEFVGAKEHGFFFDDEEEWVKPKSLWDDDDDQEVILEE